MKVKRSKSATVRAVLESPELIVAAEALHVAKLALESARDDENEAEELAREKRDARQKAGGDFARAEQRLAAVLAPLGFRGRNL